MIGNASGTARYGVGCANLACKCDGSCLKKERNNPMAIDEGIFEGALEYVNKGSKAMLTSDCVMRVFEYLEANGYKIVRGED